MKTSSLAFLITITASTVFAGGTGGGGVMSRSGTPVTIAHGTGTIQKEYIKVLGKYHSEFVIEYGQANQKNELYTTKLSLRPEEIQDGFTLNAIERSLKIGDWVELD